MRTSRHFSAIAWRIVLAAVIGCSHVAIPLSAAQGNPPQGARASADFHGWRIETFGAVVAASGDDVRLSSTTGPGGMFFRRALIADASYRLTIVGESRSGQTTVRVTLGQSQPRWLPAPNGRKDITFTGHESVEVVVYSDTPYEYRLQNLELEVCDQCAQPVALNGWQIEPFGAVESTSNPAGLTLTSAASAGGMFFRRSLDSGKAYRLRMAGTALNGATTVRLTAGGSEPRWFPAPKGAKHLTVSASESLEVVVYADAAYSYRLETLTLDECASCLTDRQLAGIILAEIPTLQSMLERDRKGAARALLHWTANVVDLGVGDGVDAATSRAYEISAAEAYQELWSEPGSGTACGGFADFFAKVLVLFGFEAFTVNFGYAGTPVTHVTTVAFIDGQFYILDPTFNGAYVVARSGELLRLRELLGKSRAGDRDYAFRTGPIARSLVFWADTDGAALRLLSTVGFKRSECEPAAAGNVRHVCRNVPYDSRVLQVEWKNELERLDLQWNDDDFVLNLMRHRVLSMSPAKQEIRQQFLDTLSASGVPFGPL